MLTRRPALTLFLALGAGAAVRRPARAQAAWRMVTEYPATAMPGEGLAHFASTMSRLSAGALAVRPGFDASEGLRSAGMLRAVAEGRVEAADAFTGALAGEAPVFGISALPFLTASTADTARLLQAARPAYRAALAGRGLSLLYATPWPATGLWSRQPLPGPEALQGLRVRTYDAAGTAVLRAAGAAPVQISFADALPRLRAGELDAVLSSGDGGAGARLWEVLPDFSVLDYASPLSLAFCGADRLAALPEAARAAVAQAAGETEARQFQAITSRLAENEARMRANGVAIATSPALRAALAQAAAPVVADWASRAGAEGEAILAAYRRG
ncbi:TRAP transporter substrate-binding protein DctP [Siccirubricoccus sp. G192]|uniref:TRAP transporter substrate-binding protein DctP n=1 Tax=Siccirubricoccus sp. G192 TaxID=2849651 RepID=UPI001C2C70B0|nr:TRAP transporter substrate-binding protein DctP [Siccirubricoccus sp. G192]MBV1799448.1 TRAP transporter substrate-binding protein DctP [Siccirubricoccus sp. G192]